jgi:hypothetical protein
MSCVFTKTHNTKLVCVCVCVHVCVCMCVCVCVCVVLALLLNIDLLFWSMLHCLHQFDYINEHRL